MYPKIVYIIAVPSISKLIQCKIHKLTNICLGHECKAMAIHLRQYSDGDIIYFRHRLVAVTLSEQGSWI